MRIIDLLYLGCMYFHFEYLAVKRFITATYDFKCVSLTHSLSVWFVLSLDLSLLFFISLSVMSVLNMHLYPLFSLDCGFLYMHIIVSY